MKKLAAVYGAGQKSKIAENVLRHHMPDIEIAYVVENKDFSKLGNTISYRKGHTAQVVSTVTLEELYSSGQCRMVIVPAAYHLFDLREIRALLSRSGILASDIYAMPYNRLMAPLDNTGPGLETLVLFDELVQIMHLDIHIVDHCNITCKSCAHFSCLVDRDVTYSADSIKKSLAHLQSIIPNITSFSLLGGEPLLHPDLDKIIKSAREYFPYASIGINTNAILLQQISPAVLSAIKEDNVTVVATLYPPVFKQVDSIKAFLEQHDIAHQIFRGDRFERRLVPDPLFDKGIMFKKCGHDMCLRGTNIGYCVIALFTDYYNEVFTQSKLPEDKGINIFEQKDGKSLLAALNTPLDLCSHCVSRDTGDQHWFEWKMAGKNVNADDWFINFPFSKI